MTTDKGPSMFIIVAGILTIRQQPFATMPIQNLQWCLPLRSSVLQHISSSNEAAYESL